jgi:thiol-disulfide isomerase/thioredoxin
MIRSIIILLIALSHFLGAQRSTQEAVHWLTFEQLEDSLAARPKKVFIDFQTDWCAYCRKMDKVVFTKAAVIEELNKNYYAVRFNAESDAVVSFGGRQFTNDQIGKSRNPLHQLAHLGAVGRRLQGDGQIFSVPGQRALVEDFAITIGVCYSSANVVQIGKILHSVYIKGF